jgi:aspartokinase/homoserine dehydrogenase 1
MALASIKVCKFGGTSVANADCVRRAIRTVTDQELPGVIVVSAMGGITNRLIESADQAVAGSLDAARATAGDLRRRHEELIDDILEGAPESHALKQVLWASVAEFEGICQSLAVLREKTPRILDVVVARGERLLAQIFARALNVSGVPTVYVDATEVISVDVDAEFVSPQNDRSLEAVRQKILPHINAGKAVVVPGFIASGRSGEIVTLGRGGSDYTATILGGLLRAERVTLYKEVDGLLTADPRSVPDARVIPELHYREATELAFYGAKVLHPRTIIPLMKDRIPLVIKNSFRPDFPGTRISAEPSSHDYPVKALTAISGQALVTILGNGMMGVPGIAGRTFSALAAEKLSTSFISQASSESSICFVLPEAEVERALEVLRRTFRAELSHGLIDDVRAQTGMAIAAVVGQGMKGHPGVAARTMLAISQAGANIVAIAQGSSELNISVAIAESDREAVLRALHREYRLHELTLRPERRDHQSDLLLCGFGQIGQTLVRQVMGQSEYFRDALGLDLRFAAVGDSRAVRLSSAGFSSSELSILAAAKLQKLGLNAEAVNLPDRSSPGDPLPGDCLGPQDWFSRGKELVSKSIFVDTTAAESFPLVRRAVAEGMHVVLANKRPLAVQMSHYDELFAVARDHGVTVRYEATVGAGLPLLDTLEKLRAAGDEVYSVRGCLSGTLGFLMTCLGQGQSFSEAVRLAYDSGYTEPDPRDDLSGMDVARKALILARSMGYRLNIEDISLEALFPSEADDSDPNVFIENLAKHDAFFVDKCARAARDGRVIRYVASISPEGVRVGLEAVPKDGPMGMLRGTDNQVMIRSRRYDTNALVVTGPGAGAEVTAAGVLNDIVHIAQMDHFHHFRRSPAAGARVRTRAASAVS